MRGSVRLSRKNRTVGAGEPAAERVLYCLAQPLSDCEIDVPQVTPATRLPGKEMAAQIISLEPLSHDVSRVILQLPAGKAVHWYAGQYLELLVPAGPSAFSIANAPDGRDLELHVRHSADNPASLEIIELLKSESLVRVRLPGGERFIDPQALPQQPVWFICGSTGFAPAKAMIESLLAAGFDQPIHLYWGARTEQDLYLNELPRQWADAGLVNYVPVLSEQTLPDMRSGLVHEAALADLVNPRQPLIHVGGSPAMAWAVFDALITAGVPAEQIHSDVFDYAPREV